MIVYQDDTRPLDVTLERSGLDLTGASVKFFMRRRDRPGGSLIQGNASVLAPPTDNRVRYTWAAGQTSTPGIYDAEWQVTYPDATKESFQKILEILPDRGD